MSKIDVEKNDLYLRVLKYANTKEVFKYSELAKNVGVEKGSETDQVLISSISSGQILYTSQGEQFRNAVKDGRDAELRISVDDKFRLLEYVELTEARKSSKTATWFATAALIVSLISTGGSIYYSHQSMKVSQPVIEQVETTESVEATE